MPQTREHVEILDVLGIKRLVVALTKVDLVDDEMRALSVEMVNELLEPTGMKGARIMPVSSETGEGFDELRAAIAEAIPEADPDVGGGGAQSRVFRMPVLRSFLVKGRGAVVTGIPMSGAIEDGGRVEVMPAGWPSRVRGIQVHHRDSEQAAAGQRTAMALPDIHVDKIKRGMTIVAAGTLHPVHRIAVSLRLLDHVKRPVEHGSRARLHLGADQLVVRIHLPMGKAVEPGQQALVELQSDKPFVVVPGDRFVLRMENAMGTLGGGVVIQALERRLPKRKANLVDALMARVPHLDDGPALVRAALEASRDAGTNAEALVAGTGLRPELVEKILRDLGTAGRARAVGRSGLWLAQGAFEQLGERIVATVEKLHAKDKAQDSLLVASIRAHHERVPPAAFDDALESLTESGTLVRAPSGRIRHKDHSDELPPEEKARCEKIQAQLAAAAGQPPDVEELCGLLNLPKPLVVRSLRLMESRGMVLRADTWWFDAAFIDAGKDKLRAIAAKEGGFTPADARGVYETTRKWVIPLLEALDKSGFSRRAGGKRVLRQA